MDTETVITPADPKDKQEGTCTTPLDAAARCEHPAVVRVDQRVTTWVPTRAGFRRKVAAYGAMRLCRAHALAYLGEAKLAAAAA